MNSSATVTFSGDRAFKDPLMDPLRGLFTLDLVVGIEMNFWFI